MSKKTEKEKHDYAITVTFLITFLVVLFVISSWYYRISGDSVNSSFFTDLEKIYNDQLINIQKSSENLNQEANKIMNGLGTTTVEN